MSVLALLGALIVGGVLALAGLVKLLRPNPAASALAAGGGVGPVARPVALRMLGALELGTALGLLVLGRPAMAVAAALLWSFAAWQWVEVARGHTGAPCACFGAQTKIGPRAASATLGLALLATALAVTVAFDGGLSTVASLAVACGLLAIISLTLAAIVFLLAREVASLRLQVRQTPPRVALEIADEGPAIGLESPLIERFGGSRAELTLAVFSSPGCAICRELEPAIAEMATRPGLEVMVFDELHDQLAWHSASVPGSPYAVAMTRHGVVLAKGTFNTLEQLASVPATARARLREGLAHV